MKDKFRLYYPYEDSNYGDMLSVPILRHYGVDFSIETHYRNANLFMVGSIIRLATKNSTVLGSGIIRRNESVEASVNYRFVRGPHTRKKILDAGGQCPEIYGDPAVLLPRIIPPANRQKNKIGFVPNYLQDNEQIRNFCKINGWKYIDTVTDDIEGLTNEITSCEKILASSLHAIIVAHAYGIPACHIRLNAKTPHGDGIKYKDYYESVGLEHKMYEWKDAKYQVGTMPKDNLDRLEEIITEYATV